MSVERSEESSLRRLSPRQLQILAPAASGATAKETKPMEWKLRLRRFGISLSVVSLAFAGALLSLAAQPALAQAPDDRYPCVSQVSFDALQVDAKLDLSPKAAVATQIIPIGDPVARLGPVDSVRIEWELPAVSDLKCVWVGIQLPETSNFMAQYILRPGEATSMTSLDVQPSGNVGTYCFRLVAMTSSARGEFVDRCVDIKNPRMARGPEDAPHPPDTGSGTQTTVGRAVTAGGVGIAAAGAGIVLLSLFGRRKRSD